jgi:hypothetical protein
MAVEILTDGRREVFFCNTSDHAFGPVLEAGEGERFLEWLRGNVETIHWAVAVPNRGDGTDPLDYSVAALERVVRFWRDSMLDDGRDVRLDQLRERLGEDEYEYLRMEAKVDRAEGGF